VALFTKDRRRPNLLSAPAKVKITLMTGQTQNVVDECSKAKINFDRIEK